MVKRILPGLGLTAYWPIGDNTWKPEMDANVLTLSALAQPRVLSRRATEPLDPVPVDGDIYAATAAWGGGAIGDIMVRDNGAWVALPVETGWTAIDLSIGVEIIFDGSVWRLASQPRFVSSGLATYNLSNTDLDGRTVIELSGGGAIVFNIPEGLTARGPVTVINVGGGNIAFTPAAGITMQAVADRLKTQWGWATIIPRSSTVYHVGGNLEAEV